MMGERKVGADAAALRSYMARDQIRTKAKMLGYDPDRTDRKMMAMISHGWSTVGAADELEKRMIHGVDLDDEHWEIKAKAQSLAAAARAAGCTLEEILAGMNNLAKVGKVDDDQDEK